MKEPDLLRECRQSNGSICRFCMDNKKISKFTKSLQIEDLQKGLYEKKEFGSNLTEHEVILYHDIWKQLMDAKCRLAEIPRELRLSDKTFYIMAFRGDEISTARYKEDLKLMKSDIYYLNEKADN